MIDGIHKKWLPLSRANARSVIPLSGIPGEPGRHCPMHTALALARQLGHISTLVVGTAECGYYSRYVMTEPRGRNGELHYVYELDANEVVFGCRKGLMEAIEEMDREGAKLILLILTCVPALIGEDMEAVIEELSGSITAKLFFIDGAHFKYNGYYTGFLDTYSALGKVFENTGGTGEKAERKSVNFLGGLRGREALSLRNTLQEAGYEVVETSPGDIAVKMERLWGGVCTILQDPNQSRLAGALLKPVIDLCRSFQGEEIRECYRTLFETLDLKENDTAKPLLSSFSLLQEKEEMARRELKGVPFMITSQELLAMPAAAYLAELGMEPKLLNVEFVTEEDMKYRDRILKTGSDPYLVTVTEEGNIREWASAHPLLSIGHSINNLEANRIFALWGYERSISLLERLMELVKEREKGGEENGSV